MRSVAHFAGFSLRRAAGALLQLLAQKIRGGVEVCTGAESTSYDHIQLLGEADVILAIGFTRYPADLVHLLQYAHKLGRRIICVTDSTLSSLVPLAEVNLFAKGTIRDFVGSLAAPGALINCVISELGRHQRDHALDRLAAAEQAARDNSIYVGGVDRSKASPGWRGSLLRKAEWRGENHDSQ